MAAWPWSPAGPAARWRPLTEACFRDEYVKSLAGTQSDALDGYRSAAVQEQEAEARLQAAEKAAQKAQAGVNSAKIGHDRGPDPARGHPWPR